MNNLMNVSFTPWVPVNGLLGLFSVSKNQRLNLLAIDLLEKIGNIEPTEPEISAAESLLLKLRRRYGSLSYGDMIAEIQEVFINQL